MKRRTPWRVGLAVGWTVIVGLLTLQPGDLDPGRLSGLDARCLVCGSRGAADAVLNVGLFVPLGLALGGTARAIPGALLVGAAVSFAIELAQTAVPGRHGGIADVVWNAIGAGVGALLLTLVLRRLQRPVRLGAIPWIGCAASALLLVGMLLEPAPTDGDYWVLFTPKLGGDPAYDGTVVEARLSGGRVTHGPLRDITLRDRLETRSWSLTATMTVGHPPRPVLPLLLVGDPRPPREILFMGVHREDLVVRERTLASRLRFDSPDLRLSGAFSGLALGDTVVVSVERDGEQLCMAVGERRSCDAGVTPGRSWAFLAYLAGPSEAQRRVVDLIWLIALFAPAGFFTSSRRGAGATSLSGALFLVFVAAVTPLQQPPALELLATVLGVLAGLTAREGWLRRSSRSRRSDTGAYVHAT